MLYKLLLFLKSIFNKRNSAFSRSIDDVVSSLPDTNDNKKKVKYFSKKQIHSEHNSISRNSSTKKYKKQKHIYTLSIDPPTRLEEIYNTVKTNILILQSINIDLDLKRTSPKHYLKINEMIQQSSGALIVLRQNMEAHTYSENIIKIIIEHTNYINRLTYQ